MDSGQIRQPSPTVTLIVALVLVALVASLRLVVLADRFVPIGFGFALIVFVWMKNRRVLWITAGLLASIAILKLFLRHVAETLTMDLLLVMTDTFVVAALVHTVITSQRRLEEHAVELSRREEETAVQNEERQSQTEELERQSEELRVANEELAQRERMLESLLDLSRTLTVELSQDEMMGKICDTLLQLVSGVAAAILMKREPVVEVQCHRGFDAEGLKKSSLPLESTLTNLVMAQMKTGYLDDASLRPDVRLPEYRSGKKIQAALAAPLLVRGRGVGTVELYNLQPHHWTEEEIAVTESLAAQASISLENVRLFHQIAEERRRLKTVFESVPVGLAFADRDLTDIRINPAGAALIGSPSGVNLAGQLSREVWTIFREGKRLPFAEYPLVRAARTGERIFPSETEVLLPTRHRVILLMSAAPFYSPDGVLSGAVASFVDITALKQLQRDLETRRREAEEANVRKTRFLAAASHDIRTPANAISLMAELIKRSADNPALAGDIRQLAGELQASAISLVELVSNVLDVTRFDTDKLELRESEFSLGSLLEEEARQVAPLAQSKNLKLEVLATEPPIWIRADRIKLGRVLGNLLGNAVKFTDSGRVTIKVHLDNDFQIIVQDTGIGISPEHQNRIFDEFFQLADMHRSAGSGLGLAICRRLVDAMGGQLSVRSAEGQGSTFTVAMPRSAIISHPDRS